MLGVGRETPTAAIVSVEAPRRGSEFFLLAPWLPGTGGNLIGPCLSDPIGRDPASE